MRSAPSLLLVGVLALVGLTGCGGSSSHTASVGGSDAGGAGGSTADAGPDSGAGGADSGAACPTGSFISPTAGANLTVADDADKNCTNGFQIDVLVATSAADGTSASLRANNTVVATATVGGAAVRFSGVQLDSAGSSNLSVQFAGSTCSIDANVTVGCSDVTCSITAPTITDTHPLLNGEPAPSGDRTSTTGSPYQVGFEVTTSAPDGSTVILNIDGGAQSTATTVSGGKATFPGITMAPDGDHTAEATCNSGSDVGKSALVTYGVDTQGPDLSTPGISDGQFFGPTDDVNPTAAEVQFDVCATTTAADALDLPTTLGSRQSNLCVAVGTATPSCIPATTGGASSGDGGCIQVTCPGGAPFDLTVSLQDEAGNVASKTIRSVACASSLPSVQIIEPIAGTGTDPTTHILAADSAQTRKDQDASTGGAQYTVVACTDAAGASARLLVGLVGGTATEAASATATPAQASDNCPTGLGNVLRFNNVTLPESSEDPLGALTAATELTVEVTDVSTAKNTSPPVQVWVDSQDPVIGVASPADLCGKSYLSTTTVSQDIFLTTSAVPITMTVDSNGIPQGYTTNTAPSGFASFPGVSLAVGTNSIAATATEPSGNIGNLASACTVTVGNGPVVTWQSPTKGQVLSASTDTDPNTSGWQGTLQVKVDATSGTVTFTDSSGNLNATANISTTGIATATVSLPDTASTTLTATTSDITGRGVGTASLTGVIIDTVAPSAPTNFTATVLDRRQTSFHLVWTAPGDGANAVAAYDVRVSKVALTAANFSTGTKITFSGTPAAPGASDSIDVRDRFIETNYWFAVEAIDKAGNTSVPVIAGPVRATFNTTLLTEGIADDRARVVDGTADLNGDGLSDLLIGPSNGNAAYLHFGSATGFAATPDVTFTGNPNTRFGQAVANIGDIDSDGFPDVAIGALLDGGPGKVYVFRGRKTWPNTLSIVQADYVIGVDIAAQPKFTASSFGISLARLGDFNGDGADDFAIGAARYNTSNGFAAVIFGVPSTQAFPKNVTLPADYGSRALGIEGETTTNAFFGQTLVGLGHVYSSAGTTLVAAAQGASKIYAFAGQSGTVVSAATADGIYTGTASTNAGITLSFVGMLSGNAVLGVGAPAIVSNTGKATLFFTNPQDGVFTGASATFTDSLATTNGDGFGLGIVGTGLSGTSTSLSFIGGPQPDVVFSSIKEGGAIPTKLYFVRGEQLTTPGDVVTRADIAYTLPADWTGTSFGSSPLRDLNGDGYADLAIGEFRTGTGFQGRVLVLW